MRIEKRFYDLAKAQWDEIEKEVRQEEESRTEAEREIEKLKTKKELQEIYRKGEEYASKWKRLPDEKQIQLFHRITKQALWMAESISCNITVEEKENSLGKIILESGCFVLPSLGNRAIHKVFSLESGCFVLPSLGNRAIHKVFSNLFLAANDACVDISSAGLCKIEFCFCLYQEVPASKAT